VCVFVQKKDDTNRVDVASASDKEINPEWTTEHAAPLSCT